MNLSKCLKCKGHPLCSKKMTHWQTLPTFTSQVAAHSYRKSDMNQPLYLHNANVYRYTLYLSKVELKQSGYAVTRNNYYSNKNKKKRLKKQVAIHCNTNFMKKIFFSHSPGSQEPNNWLKFFSRNYCFDLCWNNLCIIDQLRRKCHRSFHPISASQWLWWSYSDTQRGSWNSLHWIGLDNLGMEATAEGTFFHKNFSCVCSVKCYAQLERCPPTLWISSSFHTPW